MDHVIATKSFAGALIDGTPTKITVNFGQPFERILDARIDWWCPYQIVGMGDDAVRRIGSIDSIQALYLAFAFVGNRLATCLQTDELDMNGPNFGFPPLPEVPDHLLDGSSCPLVIRVEPPTGLTNADRPA